jgi:UMF1 family MFS transporter
MGGVQSLGRSTYSKFLPETDDTTSYFSFYDVAEKIGIVIGMLIFAIVSEYWSMRYGILFLFLFFLIGIVLLFRVPKENK